MRFKTIQSESSKFAFYLNLAHPHTMRIAIALLITLRSMQNEMDMIDCQWHIFIFLIVCTSLIVPPGNLSIILSVGLQVYNSE